MNLGLERDPRWTRSVAAHPRALITVRNTTIPVTARRAQGAEREELWQRWLSLQPSARALAELAPRDLDLRPHAVGRARAGLIAKREA
jgi:hypothetical protein